MGYRDMKLSMYSEMYPMPYYPTQKLC